MVLDVSRRKKDSFGDQYLIVIDQLSIMNGQLIEIKTNLTNHLHSHDEYMAREQGSLNRNMVVVSILCSAFVAVMLFFLSRMVI